MIDIVRASMQTRAKERLSMLSGPLFRHISIFILATSSCVSNVAQSAELEAPKILDEFSAEALKQDRGVTHHPLSWPIDRWLLEQFTQDEQFRQKIISTCENLGVTIPESSDHDSGREEVRKPIVTATTELDRDNSKYRSHLELKLNGAVGKVLPELYLRVEGLSALRRYQYAEATGLSEEQQRNIARLIQEGIDQARPFHKAI